MEAWILWLIISVILAIFEILSATFIVIWFSLGALAAMVSTYFTDNYIIHSSVFLLFSAIGLTQSKRLYNAFTSKISYKTNFESVLGKTGLVSADIVPNVKFGQVKVAGESWTASSKEKLFKGDFIKVTEVDGVKVVVEKIKEEEKDVKESK